MAGHVNMLFFDPLDSHTHSACDGFKNVLNRSPDMHIHTHACTHEAGSGGITRYTALRPGCVGVARGNEGSRCKSKRNCIHFYKCQRGLVVWEATQPGLGARCKSRPKRNCEN